MTARMQGQGHMTGQIGQGHLTTHLIYSSHSKIGTSRGKTEYVIGVECKATLEDNVNCR